MTQAQRYPFDLSLPPSYHWTSDPYPLLLFLHGRGECGNNLELVRRHGPPKLASGPKRPAFLEPFIILSPQCPEGENWSPTALTALLDQAGEDLRIDRKRIYLTGLSMGGYGAWYLALEHPERFAALCPICGGGDPRLVERFQDLPIWMFHSANDGVVPVSESDRMFIALQRCQANVTYTRYRALDHVQTWEEAYQYSMLYDWFLRQTRRGA